MENRRVYTMKEMQEMLGVSKTKVYQLAKTRDIPVFMLGRNYYCSIEVFDEWLRKKSEKLN